MKMECNIYAFLIHGYFTGDKRLKDITHTRINILFLGVDLSHKGQVYKIFLWLYSTMIKQWDIISNIVYHCVGCMFHSWFSCIYHCHTLHWTQSVWCEGVVNRKMLNLRLLIDRLNRWVCVNGIKIQNWCFS